MEFHGNGSNTQTEVTTHSAFTDCSWTCTVASGIKEYCMQWQKTVLMMFYTLRDDVLRGEWNNECWGSHLGDTFSSTNVKLTFNKSCPSTQKWDILKIILHYNKMTHSHKHNHSPGPSDGGLKSLQIGLRDIATIFISFSDIANS